MLKTKNFFIAMSLSSAMFALVTHAESASTPAAKPATAGPAPAMSPMPHPPVQPMAAGTPPSGPANANKPINILQDLNLTEEQKQKMTDWRKLQQQHMQDTLSTQEKLEELASSDKPDSTAIKTLAEKSGHDTEQYYRDYAEKNHAFIVSLTPEQRKKMKEFQQQRKEQMQQMRDRMKQQMNTVQKPVAAPATPVVPATNTPTPAPKQ